MNRRLLADGTVITEAQRQKFRRQMRMKRTDAQIQRDRLRRKQDGLVRCPRCNRRLVPAAFTINRATPDGVSRHCRECTQYRRGTGGL